MAIDSDTPVRLSMKQFLGGLGAIALMVLAAAVFLWSDVKDFRKEVKQDFKDTRTEAAAVQNSNLDTQTKLTAAISNLSGRIDTLSATINGLDTRLIEFNKRMDNYQNQLTNWNDPKAMEQFIAALQKAGLDPQQKIVIVPLR
jgi:TolA-binding protein